ncbi:hypothetical protein HNY73_013455 [Argiope bruennichi]|uniref:Pre-C2HC domain-containing protein n=1 Tax=Argiope bruennichi TaxID=94029 RepID=A0A8T0EYW9_ARGBR|nr:hypothetical protein HNY73_013455 [Argiope bruennichi]
MEIPLLMNRESDLSGEVTSLSPCPVEGCALHMSNQKRNADSNKNSPLNSPTKINSPNSQNFQTPPPKRVAKNQTEPKNPNTEIPISNRFESLNEENDKIKIHPIMLKITEKYNLTLQDNRKFPGTENSYSNEYIRISPKSEEDDRNIIKLLKENKHDYYFITPKEDRPLKVVIKGLPIKTNVEDIKTELEQLNFCVDKVFMIVDHQE